MDMHLTTQSIQLEQPLGVAHAQATVAGDVPLPGGLREETHLLQAGALAVAETAEALADRVSVTGRVVFRALYTQGAPDKVQSIEAAADFTQLCDLPGSVPRARIDTQVRVEQVDACVVGNRLSMKAILGIDARAVSTAPVEVIQSADLSGLETQTRQTTLRRTMASGSTDVLLREEFSLPEDLHIRETLGATAYPQVTEVSGGVSRIGLNGQVLLEAVHASDLPGKPVIVTRHSLPLEQGVDVAGSDMGTLLNGRARVKDVAVASQDVGDGERTLRVEVLLGLDGWADSEETITLLSDAYTLAGDDLRLTTRTLPVRTGDNQVHAAESGKAMMVLPEGSPAVRGTLTAVATPRVTDREQNGGRTTLEGSLDVTLLYMTDETSAPVSVRQTVPFRQLFAAPIPAEDLLSLTVTEIDVTPVTSDRVELRYIMHADASGMQQEQVRVVTDVQPVAAGTPTGDIVLYFTQPGESLWDIARRYRVPVREVQHLNPELTGEPHTGQGIVIWRKAEA